MSGWRNSGGPTLIHITSHTIIQRETERVCVCDLLIGEHGAECVDIFEFGCQSSPYDIVGQGHTLHAVSGHIGMWLIGSDEETLSRREDEVVQEQWREDADVVRILCVQAQEQVFQCVEGCCGCGETLDQGLDTVMDTVRRAVHVRLEDVLHGETFFVQVHSYQCTLAYHSIVHLMKR